MRTIPSVCHRSARVARALAAVALVCLGACAAFLPGTVTISREKVQSALARRFPYHASLLGVYTVDVPPPRLQFLSDVDRLGADFDVVLTDRLGSGAYQGRMTVDGGLRYEPADHTLRLTDARLRRFAVDGLPRDLQSLLEGYGRLLTAQMVGDITLYALDAEQIAQLDRSGIRPGAIHVTPFGVTVQLDEVR